MVVIKSYLGSQDLPPQHQSARDPARPVLVENAKDRHTHIPLEDYSAFVAIFQKTLDIYGGIDNLILAFTPAVVSREPGYIPGTDHAAVDDVLGPLIKAVKLGYYHWRRDQRPRPTRRLVILAAEGWWLLLL